MYTGVGTEMVGWNGGGDNQSDGSHDLRSGSPLGTSGRGQGPVQVSSLRKSRAELLSHF